MSIISTTGMKSKLTILIVLILGIIIGYMVYASFSVTAGLDYYDDKVKGDAFPGCPGCKVSNQRIHTNFGDWTKETLVNMVQSSRDLTDVGERIDFISEKFLGTPYEGNTLIGNAEIPEKLTVNLAGLDCFTYVDYVEAARLSDSYDAFVGALQNTRYKYGIAEFQYRNHFFSDWVEYNNEKVHDVTKEISGDAVMFVEKQLNQKKDGSVFLEGIPVVTRTIAYIPSVAVTDKVIKNLRTGDYIGMYADIDGLDVTHTGILIKHSNTAYLRHASSRESAQQVLDDNFLKYLKNKPGIVVYRPY